jgi:hypothetical protein
MTVLSIKLCRLARRGEITEVSDTSCRGPQKYIADLSYYWTTLEGKVKQLVWGTWCASNFFIEYKILQIKNLINNANYINKHRIRL